MDAYFELRNSAIFFSLDKTGCLLASLNLTNFQDNLRLITMPFKISIHTYIDASLFQEGSKRICILL